MVGFVLPATYAFSQGNGIRVEAELKIAGLQALNRGVQCSKIDPWTWWGPDSLDIVHYFYGGLPLSDIDNARQARPRKLVFSTTIDSDQGFLPYRLMARLGTLTPRIRTIQGEFRRQALGADLVIVRSRHEFERVEHGLGISSKKIRIVKLGVETKGIDLLAVQSTPREGLFHLSAFGQERKNVMRLIAAAGPTGIPLVIAGSGGDPRRLQEIKAAAAPFPSISFAGFLTAAERDALYLRSKVFVLPSIHEGTGLSALEAAARGCQVVITSHGGPPDYFSDHGRLVDPYDVAALRAAILAAYRDPTPAESIARLIADRFDIRATGATLLDTYLE